MDDVELQTRIIELEKIVVPLVDELESLNRELNMRLLDDNNKQ